MKIYKSEIYYGIFTIIFSFFFGIGLLGRNIDSCIYGFYRNFFYTPTEFIGGYLSTLYIGNVHFGQFSVALVLLIGMVMFFKTVYRNILFDNPKINILFLTIFTTFILSMTWPFYNFFTNSYRQGVGMGFTFIFLAFNINFKDRVKNFKYYFLLFLLIICVCFSHKSSAYIFCLYLTSLLIDQFIKFLRITDLKKFNNLSLFFSIPAGIIITFASGIIYKSADELIGYSVGPIISIFALIIILFNQFFIRYRNLLFLPSNFLPFYQLISTTIIVMFFNSYNVERIFPYYIFSISPFAIEFILRKIKQSYFVLVFIAAIFILLTMTSTVYNESLSLNLDLVKFCEKWGL